MPYCAASAGSNHPLVLHGIMTVDMDMLSDKKPRRLAVSARVRKNRANLTHRSRATLALQSHEETLFVAGRGQACRSSSQTEERSSSLASLKRELLSPARFAVIGG